MQQAMWQQLQCLGKYGYGNGWTCSEFCRKACDVRFGCHDAMRQGLGPDADETAVVLQTERNTQHGKEDRHDGSSRWCSNRKTNIASKPQPRGSAAAGQGALPAMRQGVREPGSSAYPHLRTM